MQINKQYTTKQKNLILDFFALHQNECFSAKSIIQNGNLPIGEATVYRLLKKLTQDGNLKRFIADKANGSTYQYNNAHCNSHFHLKCLNCGETICMDCSFMDRMERHVENDHEFIVDNTKTVIYGTCKECKQKI